MLLVRREYPTDIGPVDLLCRDAEGAASRSRSSGAATSTGSSSWPGTWSASTSIGRLRPVRGIFAAQQIKPQAKVLAAARGIDCVEVDYDELRGAKPADLTLF